jgi:hypothetical protein
MATRAIGNNIDSLCDHGVQSSWGPEVMGDRPLRHERAAMAS